MTYADFSETLREMQNRGVGGTSLFFLVPYISFVHIFPHTVLLYKCSQVF